MNHIDHQNPERLESHTDLKALMKFISRTVDGWYMAVMSIAYLSWAIYYLFVSSGKDWHFGLGLLFYPFLLLVVFIRHRLGTKTSDLKPIIFTLISLTFLALAPVYFSFWI